MARLDDVERQLAGVTHASQLRAPVAELAKVLREQQARLDAIEQQISAGRAVIWEGGEEPEEPDFTPLDEVPPPKRGRPRKAQAATE